MSEEELLQNFIDLVAQWTKEVGMLSSTTERIEHPSFRAIVALGERAIPWLIIQMCLDPGEWGHALHEITGEDPVLPKHRGNRRKMAQDWKRWGIEQGYLSEEDFEEDEVSLADRLA